MKKKTQHTGDVGKLEPKWDEPYQIIKKLSSGAYYLRDKSKKELVRSWNVFYLWSYRV